MVRFVEEICFLNFGLEALFCKWEHKVKWCYADRARTIEYIDDFLFLHQDPGHSLIKLM